MSSDLSTVSVDVVQTGSAGTEEYIRLLQYGKKEVEFEKYRKSIKLASTVDPTKQASFKGRVLEVKLPRSYGSDISTE